VCAITGEQHVYEFDTENGVFGSLADIAFYLASRLDLDSKPETRVFFLDMSALRFISCTKGTWTSLNRQLVAAEKSPGCQCAPSKFIR
jgi:hypothetical protein